MFEDYENVDVVCGKEVFEKGSMYSDTPVWPFVADYQSIKYYFCSKECMDKFNDDPEKYIKK